MGSTIPGHADDALAFAVRVAQLLGEGRRASTYKFAVLVGLMDLAQEELGTSGQAPTTLRMDLLARRVAELYWPHVRLYPSNPPKVLSQNRGGQAEILTAIERFLRGTGLGLGTRIAEAARVGTPFNRLLDRVELKLARMPVPLLQQVGGDSNRFIFTITWDKDVPAARYWPAERVLHLVGRSGEHLVRVAPLLRETVYRRWTDDVRSMNKELIQENQLPDFLFGRARIDLSPLVEPLPAYSLARRLQPPQPTISPSLSTTKYVWSSTSS